MKTIDGHTANFKKVLNAICNYELLFKVSTTLIKEKVLNI